MKKIVFYLAIGALLAGCGPSNLEDCLLDVSKTAQGDRAAAIGYQACQKKFPE